MKVNNLEVHYNETLLSKASILCFFPPLDKTMDITLAPQIMQS